VSYDAVFAMCMLVAVCYWLVHVMFVEGRPTRHQRCLQNTDRLERELFPHWFEEHDPAEFEFKPGAVWQVESPNYVQILRPYHDKREWLDD